LSTKAGIYDTVNLTGNQLVYDEKVFNTFPKLPPSNPTTNNQASHKRYVDDGLSTKLNISDYITNFERQIFLDGGLECVASNPAGTPINGFYYNSDVWLTRSTLSGTEYDVSYLPILQSDNLPKSKNKFQVINLVNNGFFMCHQRIASKNATKLLKTDQVMSFSFFINVSVTGSYQLSISAYVPITVDNFSGTDIIGDFAKSVEITITANSWELIKLENVLNIDHASALGYYISNGVEFKFQLKNLSGSSATCNMTGFQGNAGSTALEFCPKTYEQNLIDVQSHFEFNRKFVYSDENIVINPEMIGQHFAQSSPDNNDTQFSDGMIFTSKWWFLSDSTLCDITDDTVDVPANATKATQIIINPTYGTANKKFGVIHYIENKKTKELVGTPTSISIQARTTAGISMTNLRCAILSWSGTADSVTRDVVSSTNWGTNTQNPTLATNWAYVNTPANLALSTSTYIEFRIENAIIPANATNLAIFIYSNDTTISVGRGFKITAVDYIHNAKAKSYKAREVSLEYDLMKRYAVHNGYYNGSSGINPSIMGYAISTSVAYFTIPIIKPLMKTPTVVNYNAGSTPFIVYELGSLLDAPVGETISDIVMYDSYIYFKVTDSGSGFTANKWYYLDRRTDLGLVADC